MHDIQLILQVFLHLSPRVALSSTSLCLLRRLPPSHLYLPLLDHIHIIPDLLQRRGLRRPPNLPLPKRRPLLLAILPLQHHILRALMLPLTPRDHAPRVLIDLAHLLRRRYRHDRLLRHGVLILRVHRHDQVALQLGTPIVLDQLPPQALRLLALVDRVDVPARAVWRAHLLDGGLVARREGLEELAVHDLAGGGDGGEAGLVAWSCLPADHAVCFGAEDETHGAEPGAETVPDVGGLVAWFLREFA